MSIVDYIFRRLELKFIRADQGDLFGAVATAASSPTEANSADPVGALGELLFQVLSHRDRRLSFQFAVEEGGLGTVEV